MNSTAIETLVAQRVTDEIKNLETNRNTGSGGNGGENSHGENLGPSRACLYKDLWTANWNPSMEMETVFEISFCAEDYKVKFAACILEDATMSWWTSYKKTMGSSVVNAITWREMK